MSSAALGLPFLVRLRRDADRLGRLAGGAVFGALTILTAVFVLSLFELRADKIFGLPADVTAMSPEDAPAFWRAGEMALHGESAEAYDPQRFTEPFGPNGQGLLYLNPPHFLLFVAPLGAVDYPTAKIAIIFASIAAMAGLAYVAGVGRRQSAVFAALLLLSPAAFASALVWQTAPLVALALAVALLRAKEAPLLAGALLALLTVKPQYGILVPVFLAARGDWKAIGATALFTALLVLASAATFGVETWTAFFRATAEVHTSHVLSIARDFLSIHQTVAKLGVTDDLFRAASQLTAIAVLAFVVWRAGRRWSRETAVGVTLLAAAAASPSLWVYDWPIVAAGLLILLREGRAPPSLQVLASAAWAAPLISLGVGSLASSLAAPLLLLLVIAGFCAHRSGTAAQAVTHS